MKKIKWDVLFTWIVIFGITYFIWSSLFSIMFGLVNFPTINIPLS